MIIFQSSFWIFLTVLTCQSGAVSNNSLETPNKVVDYTAVWFNDYSSVHGMVEFCQTWFIVKIFFDLIPRFPNRTTFKISLFAHFLCFLLIIGSEIIDPSPRSTYVHSTYYALVNSSIIVMATNQLEVIKRRHDIEVKVALKKLAISMNITSTNLFICLFMTFKEQFGTAELMSVLRFLGTYRQDILCSTGYMIVSVVVAYMTYQTWGMVWKQFLPS